MPRIPCVTHGGLITEFLNYVDSMRPPTDAGNRANKAKNCAIFIFRFDHCDLKGFTIESLVENEVSHLGGIAEDRGHGKGNA